MLMTRSWTDPRTGTRWRIDVIGALARRGAKAPAKEPPAIVFRGSGITYALPTGEASRLEALEDERLAELLDRAKEGQPRPPGGGAEDTDLD